MIRVGDFSEMEGWVCSVFISEGWIEFEGRFEFSVGV